jgi:hypothetical protein
MRAHNNATQIGRPTACRSLVLDKLEEGYQHIRSVNTADVTRLSVSVQIPERCRCDAGVIVTIDRDHVWSSDKVFQMPLEFVWAGSF